jgi:hypothetical protein
MCEAILGQTILPKLWNEANPATKVLGEKEFVSSRNEKARAGGPFHQ